MSSRVWRAARLIAASLILGVVSSVLLAWLVRAYHQKYPAPVPRQRYVVHEGDKGWDATVIREFGRYSVTYQALPPPGSGWQMIQTMGDPEPVPFDDEPAWAAAMRRNTPDLVGIWRYGWPVKCLTSHSTFAGTGLRDWNLWTTPGW